jgi:Flp pilus assembly protein TadD
MIALVLAAAVSLVPAQEAFDRGDYAQAEQLALQGEPNGSGLYLAALARFRAGQFEGALQLLKRAGEAPDPPAASLWHFNQAACLYELARFAEAEQEYLLAAQDDSLAVVSLVNAAFAALDAGGTARARELAKSARGKANDERALDLVADLDAHLSAAEHDKSLAEYKDGLDAYDAGHYAAARERFLRASALDPTDGRSRIMAAASAFRLGARGAAREEFGNALALHLDEADAQTARAYLDLLRKGGGWDGSARLAAGFDSNPQQTGLLEPYDPRSIPPAAGSPLTSAELGLAWRAAPGDEHVDFEFDYALSQLAYTDSTAADRSLQQHLVLLAVQTQLAPALRGGLLLGGEADFAGLGNFRTLQTAARIGGFLSLAEGKSFSTRLDASVSRKQGAGLEFAYLTGNRADASITQNLQLGVYTLDVGYAFRLEDIGSVATPSRSCEPRLGGCEANGISTVEPFGYTGHTFWFSTRMKPTERVSLELLGGVELRSYMGSDSTVRPSGQQRDDQLFFGSATALMKVNSKLAVSVRYDLVNNVSNSSEGTVDGHSYMKGVLSLGTLIWW